jgi:hypothetical protein
VCVPAALRQPHWHLPHWHLPHWHLPHWHSLHWCQPQWRLPCCTDLAASHLTRTTPQSQLTSQPL